MKHMECQIDLELDQNTARKLKVIAEVRHCTVEDLVVDYLTQYVENYPLDLLRQEE